MPSTVQQYPAEVISHLDRSRVHLISYLKSKIPDLDEELVGKAVEFSIMAHKNQYRNSGMPYAEHPFEVAKILADFNMDSTTVIAGLLHDVVEDTDTSMHEIEREFGKYVAFLVAAVTKISSLQTSRIERQAETFRKMLLSVARDFRVIIIKFADRLHNMRTLGYMQEEKKKAIAAESLEVYAPLAHRFGLAKIRGELEDLAFKHLNPNVYQTLVDKVVNKREEREKIIRSLIKPVKGSLNKANIKAKVFGRPKHFYSIYRKMEHRGCRFEDVYDIIALRIIVKSVGDCYSALGIVHNFWPPLQTRFKDFISAPKSNMYQSLHTTLVGPDGKPVEVQIRTDRMDLTAEYGVAAHWAYKEGKKSRKVGQENRWLKQFIDWQKDLTDSAQFMDFFRVDLKFDEVFVFTPKGDLLQLPKGATALDFAFAVHTEVGIRCSGAKVDGKIVPLDKGLRTGSTVEILKTKEQHPSGDWLRIVITAKAKSSIRRWLKNEEQEKSIQLGKELLSREFRTIKISPEAQTNFESFKKKYLVGSWEALYRKIGNGEITLGSLRFFLKRLYPGQPRGVLQRVRFKKNRKEEVAVLVSGMDNMLIRFASCCQPIPGDKIMGYVTEGRGVSIHRAKCPEGIKLFRDKDRVVPVNWNDEVEQAFDVFIEIRGKDKKGLLNEITKAFTDVGVNVERASIVTFKGQIRNKFKVQVVHLEQLEMAFERLRKIKEVRNVIRKQPGKRNKDEDITINQQIPDLDDSMEPVSSS